LFILSVAYFLLNAASYNGEILHTDAGQVLGFMSTVVVVTKIMTFFQKCGAVISGRSVRPQTVGLYLRSRLAAAARWPATVM